MTRSVNFGGQTQYKPGGVTRVQAETLSNPGTSDNGVLHLIGEADAGEPHTVITMDDPSRAKEIFGSGPLADACVLAYNASNDPRVPGAPSQIVAYKTNLSTQATLHVPGDEALISDTATGDSTTTVITVTTGGLTADTHIGRWVKATLSTGAETRRITDNAAATITVSPPFSSAPLNTNPVVILEDQMVLTTEQYGADCDLTSFEMEPGVADGVVLTIAKGDTVEQSPEIGGDTTLRIKYAGGPITATGTPSAVTTSTVTVDVGSAPSLDDYADMVLEFSDGRRRLISGNSAADPTIITLASGHELTAAEVTAFNASPTAVYVRNVTAATVSVTGANGVATGMTTTVTPTADDLTLTFSTIGSNLTLRQFANYLNTNTSYEAEIPDGVNPDTTLMADLDFGTRATSVDVRFDDAITPTTKGSLRSDLKTVIDWINEISELVTAERATGGTGEGSELPTNTGGVSSSVRDTALYFTGGSRGISTNTYFQNGFDALKMVRGNHVVPLISEDLTNEGNGSTATLASVAAQLSSHLDLCNGIYKNECGGYLGVKGTKAEILAQAKALNYTDVQVVVDECTVLNIDGTLTAQPAWSSAVMAAAMRASMPEVGEPLTKKFVKTTAITHDTSWDSKDITDQNDFLKNGVMFLEDTGTGYRWMRDITTHVQNDKTVFTSGSTRDATRYIAYDLRTSIEDEFTGVKGKAPTVSNIKTFVANKMRQYKGANIIVESLDPETGTILIPDGFRKLRVFLSGDVVTIRVEIFVCTEIAFQLNDINLQIPRLSA